MECTRLVAAVLAIATAFGTVSAGLGATSGPAPVHLAAAAAPAPATPRPVVSVWAAGLEGAVTAANRAW